MARLSNYPPVADKSITEQSPVFYPILNVKKTKLGAPQAVPVPGSKQEGYSEIYRNVHSPEQLITTVHPKITNVVEAFEACVAANKDSDCWGEREFDYNTKTWGKYVYETYESVAARRLALGKGIADVVQEATGLDSRVKPYVVGLYGPNCINWLLTDLACQTQTLASVCLYDTLGPESSEYIMNLTEMPVIVAAVSHIPFLLKTKPRLPHLKVIIAMHELSNPAVYEKPGQTNKETLESWANSLGVGLVSLGEVERRGETSPRGPKLPTGDDILTINFTSGTTGNPKGVIINHRNVVAALLVPKTNESIFAAGSSGFISFLPLAHIYERLNLIAMICNNVRIGFFHGEMTEVMEDILAYHPTFIAGVPRIWNRIAAAIRATTIEAPGITGALSRRAYAAKLKRLEETGDYTHPLWDRLWSNKIRAKLGMDLTKTLATGSAPMAKENIELLKVALSVEFVQGYGLTESMSGVTLCVSGENESGSVGPPNVATEIRLRDLPDYNYSSVDKPYPRGEIMIRGPQIFMGYYKNEEATKGAIDPDGWFHSGDVGMIDDLGRLYVIDRVKNFFKLAQGEYVGPERIEALYQSSSSLIGQVFIEGNSFETYLVSIIGVNPESYVQFLAHHFKMIYQPSDLEKIQETFNRKDIRSAFLKELNHQARGAQLKGYEKIKNVTLMLEPFGMHNGTMTPTLKIKRPDAAKLCKKEIDSMYKEGPLLEDKAKI